MLLSVLYVVGITAEAVTAALSAGRQKMDLFGVMAIACMTALGGGTIRDIIIDHHPVRWVANPEYLVIVCGAALVTVGISWLMRFFSVLFLFLDAVGLSVFAVLGAQVAIVEGHGLVIAIVCSVATGVFGGVLRDIFSDRVPLVFSSDFYASVAILAACQYYLMHQLGVDESITIVATLLTAVCLRLLALRFDLGLPNFDYSDEGRSKDPRRRLSKLITASGVRGKDARKRRLKIAETTEDNDATTDPEPDR